MHPPQNSLPHILHNLAITGEVMVGFPQPNGAMAPANMAMNHSRLGCPTNLNGQSNSANGARGGDGGGPRWKHTMSRRECRANNNNNYGNKNDGGNGNGNNNFYNNKYYNGHNNSNYGNDNGNYHHNDDHVTWIPERSPTGRENGPPANGFMPEMMAPQVQHSTVQQDRCGRPGQNRGPADPRLIARPVKDVSWSSPAVANPSPNGAPPLPPCNEPPRGEERRIASPSNNFPVDPRLAARQAREAARITPPSSAPDTAAANGGPPPGNDTSAREYGKKNASPNRVAPGSSHRGGSPHPSPDGGASKPGQQAWPSAKGPSLTNGQAEGKLDPTVVNAGGEKFLGPVRGDGERQSGGKHKLVIGVKGGDGLQKMGSTDADCARDTEPGPKRLKVESSSSLSSLQDVKGVESTTVAPPVTTTRALDDADLTAHAQKSPGGMLTQSLSKVIRSCIALDKNNDNNSSPRGMENCVHLGEQGGSGRGSMTEVKEEDGLMKPKDLVFAVHNLLAEKNQQVMSLLSEKAEWEALLAEKDKLVEGLRSEKVSVEIHLAKAEQQIESLRKEHADLTCDLVQKIRQLESQEDELKKQLSERDRCLEKVQSEKGQLKNRLGEIEQQLKGLSSENKGLSSEISELKLRCSQESEMKAGFQRECAALKDVASDKEREIGRITAENDGLKSRLADKNVRIEMLGSEKSMLEICLQRQGELMKELEVKYELEKERSEALLRENREMCEGIALALIANQHTGQNRQQANCRS